MRELLQNKNLGLYLLKFLGAFCLLFYGTEAVIGLSAPGNRYSDLVATWFDFITPLRTALLQGSIALLSVFDLRAGYRGDVLFLHGGEALRMSYSCIGYGVLSFWIAFVVANRGTWSRKLRWIAGGYLLLCTINIVRVSLLLVAVNRGWTIPFGWDHHTWFNLVCYLFIFAMIYRFDRSVAKPTKAHPEKEQGQRTTFTTIKTRLEHDPAK